MERKISKVKYSKGKVEIEFTETEGTREEERKLKCNDQPRPEFEQCFTALAPQVTKILEQDEKFTEHLVVTSVSVSAIKDVLGAVITAQKKLVECNAPWVINTPFLPGEPPDHINQNTPTLPEKAAATIDTLIVEAERYIDGERAQLELDEAK